MIIVINFQTIDYILHYVLRIILEYLNFAAGLLEKYVKDRDGLYFGHILSTKKDNNLICQLRNGINAGMADTLKCAQKFCEKIDKKIEFFLRVMIWKIF